MIYVARYWNGKYQRPEILFTNVKADTEKEGVQYIGGKPKAINEIGDVYDNGGITSSFRDLLRESKDHPHFDVLFQINGKTVKKTRVERIFKREYLQDFMTQLGQY